jgi:hypothetical protein
MHHTSGMLKMPLAIAVLLCATSMASPVFYDESVDGDLAAFGAPLPVFGFDLGTNIVAGTFGWAALDLDSVDADDVAFSILDGHQLAGASVTLADAEGDLLDAFFELRTGFDPGRGTLLSTAHPTSPGFANFPSVLPLGPGIYHVRLGGFSAIPPAYSDYTFRFDVVSTAPEPSTLGLAAFAGLMLLGSRIRHFRTAH